MTSQSPRPGPSFEASCWQDCIAVCPIWAGLICQESIDCITHFKPRVFLFVNSHSVKSAIKSSGHKDMILTHKSPSIFWRLKDRRHIWGCGLGDFFNSNRIVLFFRRFVSLSLKEITTENTAEKRPITEALQVNMWRSLNLIGWYVG